MAQAIVRAALSAGTVLGGPGIGSGRGSLNFVRSRSDLSLLSLLQKFIYGKGGLAAIAMSHVTFLLVVPHPQNSSKASTVLISTGERRAWMIRRKFSFTTSKAIYFV